MSRFRIRNHPHSHNGGHFVASLRFAIVTAGSKALARAHFFGNMSAPVRPNTHNHDPPTRKPTKNRPVETQRSNQPDAVNEWSVHAGDFPSANASITSLQMHV